MAKPLVKGCCPYVEPDAPQTAYAISRAIEGDTSAWPKVFTGILQRALFIAPGLALSGIRGNQLIKSSIISSATISGCLFIVYALRKKGIVRFR